MSTAVVPDQNTRPWLLYALVTTACWGVWGALIELPEKAGFPATLGYVVWSLTMIPPALVALSRTGWRFDWSARAARAGLLVGLTGAGGQLVLFQALRDGPAYLVFPIVSLSPVVTIGLSMAFLGERTDRRGALGIALALVAIVLFSVQPSSGSASGALWLVLALVVFAAWGVQGYWLKTANEGLPAEVIFGWMALAGLALAPVAVLMTDFGQPIEWGWRGPGAAALIQTLNAVGALALVYAFRYGRAIVVAPLTNAVAPVLTVLLSLALYAVVPRPVVLAGIVCALAATFLLAREDNA